MKKIFFTALFSVLFLISETSIALAHCGGCRGDHAKAETGKPYEKDGKKPCTHGKKDKKPCEKSLEEKKPCEKSLKAKHKHEYGKHHNGIFFNE